MPGLRRAPQSIILMRTVAGLNVFCVESAMRTYDRQRHRRWRNNYIKRLIEYASMSNPVGSPSMICVSSLALAGPAVSPQCP